MIIVGAGAGGGVAAGVLAEVGRRVLLLERGQSLAHDQVPSDHLRNHRLPLYGHNTGPDLDGNPRVVEDRSRNPRVVRPHENDYHNNAMTVGGGTRVYGAQAWRFMPQDFRMASLYGVPDGSSLADWPISYDDLAPFYDRAEWELGVAGRADIGYLGARQRPYPMPPVHRGPKGRALEHGARVLGLQTQPAPMLINTTPYNGRPACVQCQFCVGFSCPSDAKTGTHNTAIPRALASGNCELVTRAIAERINTDGQGNVTGVTFFVDEASGVRRESAVGDVVIVSGGAIESARLLLNSRSALHPNGLGNAFDMVGRNLQGHYYHPARGLMDEDVYDGLGPGVSIATTDFNHGNPGVVGGGMLADEFILLPIIFWRNGLPPDVPRWGIENKRWMRENYRRTMQVYGPVQEIPNPESRVTVEGGVLDRYGIPVARLSGTAHAETIKTAEFMRDRALDWLNASGATRVWSGPVATYLSGGQHQAGTCRMGDDSRTSVTDKWGRVHGHDILFVVDGSLHVTNGGFNPVLTILALAYRSAEHIAHNC